MQQEQHLFAGIPSETVANRLLQEAEERYIAVQDAVEERQPAWTGGLGVIEHGRQAGEQIPKTIQCMQNTIAFSRYSFDDLLEDRIYKTALLIGLQEYRIPQKAKSEAKEIRNAYEKLSNFEDLVVVAMGKESLKAILTWLNEEKKLNLSRADLLSSLQIKDIPKEIQLILEQLRSNAAKPAPINVPELPVPEISEDEDDVIDQPLQHGAAERAPATLWS